MKRWTVVVTLGLLVAAPSWAGMYYKSTTRQDGAPGADQMNMDTEAWIEGDSAKIQFGSSAHPFMKEGTYLLTRDGGASMYLVNPQDKTYSEWDLDEMMQMAGRLMEGMGGMFEMTFEDPQAETLLEEDGGSILGMPTTHHRYRTTYSLRMKVMGMKQSSQVEMVQDVWATDDIDEAAFGVWMRKQPPKTGNAELDKLIEIESAKIKGFPLKVILESSTTGEKGKAQTVRTITEVTELERVSVADGTFEVPADYEQVEIMPDLEGMGGEEGAGSPFGGLFGRKKKTKD